MQACLSHGSRAGGMLLHATLTQVVLDVLGDLVNMIDLHHPLGHDLLVLRARIRLVRHLDRDIIRDELGVRGAPVDTTNRELLFASSSVLSVTHGEEAERLNFDLLLRLLDCDRHGILLGADAHPLQRRRHDAQGDTLLGAKRHVPGGTSLADHADDAVALLYLLKPRAEVDLRANGCAHGGPVLAGLAVGEREAVGFGGFEFEGVHMCDPPSRGRGSLNGSGTGAEVVLAETGHVDHVGNTCVTQSRAGTQTRPTRTSKSRHVVRGSLPSRQPLTAQKLTWMPRSTA